jgi:hypothetical protein
MRLHPDLDLAQLQAAWQRHPNLRIDNFLHPDDALAIRDAIRVQPHHLILSPSANLAFQYWVYAQVPDDDCDHVICRAGRWLWSDGVAFLAQVTGLPIRAPDDRQLVATLYDKGSYLDPHNDYNGVSKVAFIFGLTDPATSWPYDEGGWLTFYDPPERRPPGWNTLDLFDVRAPDRAHAVPIVTGRRERRALSGWFY